MDVPGTAISRLIRPPLVEGWPVVVVAAAGIAVNITAASVLAKANRTSLNMQGPFRHVLTDLYGFIGTVIAGLIIVATGYTRADAIASLVVVALMLKASWELLRDSGRILLEAAPADMDLHEVRTHLLETRHVHDVHDLHIWTVTSGLRALSAHVIVDDSCFDDGHVPRLLDELQACLLGHFDLEHSTFQLEAAEHAGHETGTTH
jgi:cobalt-zinc-cadmium efflux system protein